MFHPCRLLSISALLLLCSGSLPAQSTGQDCTALVSNRSYTNSFSGFLNVPAFFPPGTVLPAGVGLVPNGGAGVITFLRNGTFHNQETLAIGLIGLEQDLEIDGTYSLRWDQSQSPAVCSGTMSGTATTPSGPMSFDFALIVSADGEHLNMIHTNPGLIVGAANVLGQSACRTSLVSGNYLDLANGWIVGPPAPPDHPEQALKPEQTVGGYIPFAFNGALRLLPHVAPSRTLFPESPADAGTVLGWDTASQNGEIVPRSLTGWYQVDRHCRGTMVLRDNIAGHGDFHLELFVGRDGDIVDAADVDTLDGTPASPPLIILGMQLNRISDHRKPWGR